MLIPKVNPGKFYEDTLPGRKLCKNCKQQKPFNMFDYSSNSDDGYHPICTRCKGVLSRRSMIKYLRLIAPVGGRLATTYTVK